MLDAMRARDGERLVELMRVHNQAALASYLSFLNSAAPGA